MAIKFEKVTAGSILLDVRRTKMGNTKMSEWSCWKVAIDEVEPATKTRPGRALVRWNIVNPPKWWSQRLVERLYLNPPKGYREQCARGGSWGGRPTEPHQGRIGPAPAKAATP